MNTNKIDTPTLILIIIIMMGLINGLMSCSPKYGPTKREIKKAMKYSSWEYKQPDVQIMIPNSKSNFVFTTNK